MRRRLLALALIGLAGPTPVRADGLLVPTDRSLPPLSLVYERVSVEIDGQVATTSVEQSYANSTGRVLEAEYLFPLPAGASVRDFSMWVGGKKFKGEAVEAGKARQTYEDIVRRLEDPGLLEYVGRDLWKMRIYPVPARGHQKIEIRFTTLLAPEGDLIAYRYPLRTGQTPRTTVGDFTMVVRLKSPAPLGPIYSPSHEVTVHREGEREAVASFAQEACMLDRDFLLYFAPKSARMGVSLLAQRDTPGEDGYFLLLLSPRTGGTTPAVPRDMVFVLDTSSSMTDEKLKQAKRAVFRALDSLEPGDRFGLIRFSGEPTPYREGLTAATPPQLDEAREWVEDLRAHGSTDISAALLAALKLRPERDPGRAFQVVFVTDGLPTVGPTGAREILESVRKQGDREARIFTFGVGDDVDAPLLDQLAETTRGSSTYVRPSEDLERKVSQLMAKIQHPVRTDLKLKLDGDARLVEMFPPRLPDLFQGEQLQVVGRYEGSGPAKLTLKGRSGERTFSETYEVDFPEMAKDRDFLAPLWARRKVGYLLDQLRLHGESSEAKEQLIQIAREYSIATPYTSLLVIPDAAAQARQSGRPPRRRSSGPALAWPTPGFGMGGMGGGMGGMGGGMGGMGGGMGGMGGGMGGMGGGMGGMGGGMGGMRGGMGAGMGGMGGGMGMRNRVLSDPLAQARPNSTPVATPPAPSPAPAPTAGPKEAIDLAQRLSDLKTAGRGEGSDTVRTLAGKRFRKVGAAWVDERFEPSSPTLKLRFLGAAYFRLLERHPEIKAILALGDRVTWVSPSGTAVVIDKQGKADVPNAVLDRLFDVPK